MNKDPGQQDYVENVWRTYLTTGDYETERRHRQLFRLLPGYPRCKTCYAPFNGLGSRVARIFFDKHPSKLNPRLCNA